MPLALTALLVAATLAEKHPDVKVFSVSLQTRKKYRTLQLGPRLMLPHDRNTFVPENLRAPLPFKPGKALQTLGWAKE